MEIVMLATCEHDYSLVFVWGEVTLLKIKMAQCIAA